ncbi:hypothetical protein [Streptomyces sp. CB03911]|uniref:hypothetical protein n=1 Tax=Streptomyces sp. CB03911 TaxID=1804758 RepID=UPI000939A9EB|nr:hypothetical protein [Streptomyces sp. CB03911]OKI16635.1 hypothetical protein A6A07_11550 [Streptomyces sp. CB03911]
MTSTTTTRVGLYKTSSDGSDLVNVVTDLLNNWDAIDLNIGYRDCTSTTRPSTVWKGLPIRESDTGRLYVSNGTAPASGSWVQIPAAGASFLAAFTFAGAVSLNSTLAVTGATTLSSTLAVTGATTLSSTLGVTGAVTLNSTLAVTGNITNSGTISSLTSSAAEDTTSRTTTSTSLTTIAGALAATLTVPPSGKVKVTLLTLQRNSGAGNTFSSFRAAGSVSGTNFTETLTGSIGVTGTNNSTGMIVRRLTGLTAGETLTVTPYHMVNSGTGTYDYRYIMLEALGV